MTSSKIQLVFGGCGGMYNYVLGISSVLQKKFDLSNCIFTGVSAGCFPAMMLALGEDIETKFKTWNLPFLRKINKRPFGALCVWNDEVKRVTLENLPDDAYQRLSDRLFISLSRIPYPYSYSFSETNATAPSYNMGLKNEIVSKFHSNQDLVDAVIASSFVPFFDKKLAYKFRDNYYVDGSLTNYRPIPLPTETNPVIDIRRDTWRKNHTSWLYCWSHENWVNLIYNWGKTDAEENITYFDSLIPKT